jgi:DNA repair ATPase RecN
MIEESLVESARLIRNQFNNLFEELDRYESEVKDIAKYLLKAADEIKKIAEDSEVKDLTTIRDNVLHKLGDVDFETNKVVEKINDINNKMDRLREEELMLYNLIKKRYPSLSDEEIKIEIQRRI